MGDVTDQTYDFVIVGSGFGGSVSAMRLAQKGYRVAVVEAGKRWGQTDFPGYIPACADQEYTGQEY